MTSSTGWQFWIDRGGTFTDVVARSPDERLLAHKLLSDNPERYADAAVQGIRELLGLASAVPLPAESIDAIRIGTTLGTNALLTRSGRHTLLAIKERLDFSCAVFDAEGDLIANAPHIPVHLGSMSESVKGIVEQFALEPGDVYLMNSPYHGGTHLPDITVVTPMFDDTGKSILFFTASRGHHADIGGVSPGSMPPNSTRIDEEGVWTEGMKIVSLGKFLDPAVRDWLSGDPHPARNPEQNIADLRAQIAANEKGVQELQKMVEEFTLRSVQAYMGHVKDHAEEAVRQVIGVLKSGEFRYHLDNGDAIVVAVSVDREARTARIDFSGTSRQRCDNFNAPPAVTKAAVLYVFRTLVAEPKPMAEPHMPAGLIEPELAIVTDDGVKVADLAWMRHEVWTRIKTGTAASRAREICVEVFSDCNTLPEIEREATLYFARGAKEVWVCDEGRMSFYVAGSARDASQLAPKVPAAGSPAGVKLCG